MDVHVRRAVTLALRLRSVDVITAQEDQAAEFDDPRLLQRATELHRVLVSQDEDLLCEAARRRNVEEAFLGLIYAHQLRITIAEMVDDLELIAKATAPDEWRSQIVYLPIR